MKKPSARPCSWTWIEGEVMPTTSASIGVLDRGFLYGDSIFETLLARKLQPIFLDDHLQRLREGADRLRLPFEYADDSLREFIDELLTHHPPEQDVVVRITLTRGDRIDGEIGIVSSIPRLVVMSTTVDSSTDSRSTGIELLVAKRRKIPPACLDPNVKSGNYLASILARSEAQLAGAEDAIMLSLDGIVTEATSANLFWIADGTVYTCSDDLVLPGITRKKILWLLEDGEIDFETGHYPLEHLLAADEAFLTGSICGVDPIGSIQQRLLRSPQDRSLSRRLQQRYEDLIVAEISGRIR